MLTTLVLSLQTIRTIIALTQALKLIRADKKKIAFVPTMGAIHAGHLALIKKARAVGDFVVVSIFVNQKQFCSNEDFSRYPRTPKKDQELLKRTKVDLLFMPSEEEIYPLNLRFPKFKLGYLEKILEGKIRPEHFQGVAQVVWRLFDLVKPSIAIFGQKDYQQTLVIKKITRDLKLPIKILVEPTIREASGLALSSRNIYLTFVERKHAVKIHQVLKKLIKNLEYKKKLIHNFKVQLIQEKINQIDYAVIRDAETLKLPRKNHSLVALTAIRIGKVRLIDNEIIKL